MASGGSKESDFDEDVPKLAPQRLPTAVKMAVIKQPTAANANQTEGELPAMKFDHVFSASLWQEDAPKRIIFTETVTGEGSSWIDNETGVWVQFSSKAVLDPKLITCSLWRSDVASLPLEDNESLVSNVIELTCDDPVGINYCGVTVALSHSATDLGGYELVMKELIDSENKTWKDLETANVSDLSDLLGENSESQNELRFLQGKITSFSLYAVICRLKSYIFSSQTSLKSSEFKCQVPEYPDVSVTIPRRCLSKDLILTIKVQQVPHDDSEERRVFIGPILHVLCSLEVELKEPASIRIPITLEQDQMKMHNLPSRHIRIFYRDTKEKSREWVEITRQLKTPAKLENGVVAFQINHFSKIVTVITDTSEELDIRGLLDRDSSVPQHAGFLSCLYGTENPVEHLLVLCCYPLQMKSIVWKDISARKNVLRLGQDTSRCPLSKEEKVFFFLPDAFALCKEREKETSFLKFLGNVPFEASFPVRVAKTESLPQIKFFKQNGHEETLCNCTLSIVAKSPIQTDYPSTLQDMSGYFAKLLEQRKELVTPGLILKIKDDAGTCWKDLGIALEIKPEAKVHNLEQDQSSNRDRADKVLQMWMDQEGSNATVGRLACALITIGKKGIAEKLLGDTNSNVNQRLFDDSESEATSRFAGEESMQPTERETPDDIFSLLAEVKEMRKIAIEQSLRAIEQERHKKEIKELNEMLEKVTQMKVQVQHLT